MEYRLFAEGTVPECATPAWYATRDTAPHIDQALHQDRLRISAVYTAAAVRERKLTSVVDLGCGDGGLLQVLAGLLPAHVAAWGYDLQPSNIDVATTKRAVDVRYGDVLTGDVEWGELAIATEMLEHLVAPGEFLREVAKHSPALVASSPWTETDQAHYEHHLWAWDQAGYRALVEQAGYEIVERTTTGMFQVVWAVKP